MEQFYLEEPSLKRKNAVILYMEEHKKYNSKINGAGGFDHVLDGVSYEECLNKAINMQKEEYANSINRCPGKEFFLIRKNDNKLIGMINIRNKLNSKMLEFGGHIGYGIRPTERRKGYNKINLYLGLLEAKKMGLTDVMLSCSVTNIGSDKTIQALGGVLERTAFDPRDNELSNVYWINIEKSLNNYGNIYEIYSNKGGSL